VADDRQERAHKDRNHQGRGKKRRLSQGKTIDRKKKNGSKARQEKPTEGE